MFGSTGYIAMDIAWTQTWIRTHEMLQVVALPYIGNYSCR